MGRDMTKREIKTDWRKSLARMEQQGNYEGARYFRALLGGWSEYEARAGLTMMVYLSSRPTTQEE